MNCETTQVTWRNCTRNANVSHYSFTTMPGIITIRFAQK